MMPHRPRYGEVDDVMKEWRTRAVTIILYIAIMIALPAYVVAVVQSISIGVWQMLVPMTAVYMVIIVVAIVKNFDFRVRGSVFIAAGYMLALTNLVNTGLEGSGRVYLVALPIIAFILIGTRSGWITTALSILIYGAFSLLAYSGMLETWMMPLADRTATAFWITGGATLIMLLVVIVVLLMRMNRFLLNSLKAERRISAELEQTYDETLEGWARALELRDIETAGHCHRVSEITKRLAGEVGLANDGMDDLYRGALLHDIGKMGIPDSILLKPGKLTAEEFKQMQEHTTYAYDLLSHIPYLLKALDIPYCHHEKWDGTGYPRGLKGADIPLSARIFAVVDVYDALTSDRPYRQAWPEEQALAYIKERSGTEFAPTVVKAFVKLADEEMDSLMEP
jgi:hypothetical protein